MTDSTRCPVCGRKDIQDYHQGDVRCPECGSDLKVFRLLDDIEKDSKSKATVWKPVAIMALVAAVVFAFLYFGKSSNPSADAEKVALLQDSISSLNERLKDAGISAQPAAVTKSAEKEKAKDKEEVKSAASEEKAALESKSEEAEASITAPADKVTIKDGKKIYVVQRGDSWWKISQKLYKGKIKDVDIAKMNGHKASDQLEVGQELVVK